MQRTQIDSSLIASVGYDEGAQVLEVEFKRTGNVWYYEDVPPGVYNDMMDAPSVGSFFLSYVKNRYSASSGEYFVNDSTDDGTDDDSDGDYSPPM